MLSRRDARRLVLELASIGRPVFVVADHPGESWQALRRIEEAWHATQRGFAALAQFAVGREPFSELRRAASGGDVGFVAAFTELLRSDEARHAWARGLNVRREALRNLGAPVVFFVEPAMLDVLAQEAPDFWSWRGRTYEGRWPSPAPPRSARESPRVPGPPVDLGAGLRRLAAAPGADAAPWYVDPGDDGWGPVVRRIAADIVHARATPMERVGGPGGVGLSTALWAIAESIRLGGRAEPLVVSLARGDFESWWTVDFALAAALIRWAEAEALPDQPTARARGILAHRTGVHDWGVNGNELPASLSAGGRDLLVRFSKGPFESVAGYLLTDLDAAIRATGRPDGPVLLVDGFDQMPPETTAEVWSESFENHLHGMLPCPVVLSCPASALLSPDVSHGRWFPPSASTNGRPALVRTVLGPLAGEDGATERIGRAIVERRLGRNLIEEAAVDSAVRAAAGLPGMLMSLLRDAVLEALQRGADRISSIDVNSARRAAMGRIAKELLDLSRAERLTSVVKHGGIPDPWSVREGFVLPTSAGTWSLHPLVAEVLGA